MFHLEASSDTALQKAVPILGCGLHPSPVPCSGAMAEFGDRKVIPGVPRYMGEKDLKASSAEGLIFIPFIFFFSKTDTGSYGTHQLSATCGLMQFKLIWSLPASEVSLCSQQ